MVHGFVKQRGHCHHPVPIWPWRVLVLIEGGRMHLIPSAIALTPYCYLVRLQPPLPPTRFPLHPLQLVSSISALAFLAIAAYSLQASLPSLERYHTPS